MIESMIESMQKIPIFKAVPAKLEIIELFQAEIIKLFEAETRDIELF